MDSRFKIATIATDFGHKVNIVDQKQKTVETEKKTGAALLNAIRENRKEIFEGFGIKVEDIRYAELVTRFKEHFKRE